MAVRDYIFYELTNSICPHCFKKLEAKIIIQDNKVFMVKQCPEHGKFKVLISDDAEYYKKTRNFLKPGDIPQKFGKKIEKGCPYDCGLCADHEQHSCVSIIEVTDRCNLTCPTCYAASSPSNGTHRTLGEIEKMLDIVVESEGRPDVVQLSGGEPTLHPDFFKIMEMAKAKPIRHLMINTNGYRIAHEPDFVEKLAGFMPGIEVYLQFDSFNEAVLKRLRGQDVRQWREKAIAHLNEFNISTTLVVTLQKSLNDGEIGEIIDYAKSQKCIRGITFQPVQYAGRNESGNPQLDRLTLTGVRNSILAQSTLFAPEDLIPVPCHPDAIMMGYALKLGDEIHPLTRYFSPEDLLSASRNTINFETLPEIQAKMFELFSTANSPQDCTEKIAEIMCCLPKIEIGSLNYSNLFRIIVKKFYDSWDFDVRGVKKSCVHIVHKDGRIIPFDTMNLFYRDPKDEEKLMRARLSVTL